MVCVATGCPNTAVTTEHREPCSELAAAFPTPDREGCGNTCLASKHPWWQQVKVFQWEAVGAAGTEVEEQVMPVHCPREDSSWEQLHPKACKLHSEVTIPKRTVHVVLEERTFIPVRVPFSFLFDLVFERAPQVLCVNVLQRSPRLHPSQQFLAASSLQQLLFPQSSCSGVCVHFPAKG